ncbi:MAG: efflux RND transporter permease subunit, partial [Gemmatimonadota bacterium]|nr:efflux RND transporter permease subunit [Gemmatimonadota bacterium]
IMRLIPMIVILTLIFSLIESLFILPAHLAHAKIDLKKDRDPPRKRAIVTLWQRVQNGVADGLLIAVDRYYRPFLEWALQWRYLTLAGGVATLFLTVGLVGGGWIKFVFFPNVESDNIVAMLTMPQGTPAEVTEKAVRQLEASAQQLQREIEGENSGSVFRHVFASVGEQPYRAAQGPPTGNAASFSSAHLGEVYIELMPSENRDISSEEIANRWRKLTGTIPDAVELTYSSSLFSSGEAINIQFSGPDYGELREVAEKFKSALNDYPGVFDIADSFRPGKEEVKLSLTRQAETLGITLADLARQVRQAFYGEEAQRIQRGRDDIRVMVRYPESERRSLGNLEDMRIRTPSGGEVPFSIAASAEIGRGYASIRRADRQRVINVTSDVDISIANANEIIAECTRTVLPQILADHPRVRYDFEGQQREQDEMLQGLAQSFVIALLVIYILLAIPFKSYVQPLIVMGAIPFGIVGAAWGHVALGFNLSILSVFGIVALTGIVVNDSLVMVDFINKQREKGHPLSDALREAGAVRFRPILLTSVTTFLGLTPLLLEKSLQAQFLVPMAISLGFGVLFATVITLLLVPITYNILEDIINAFYHLIGRERRAFRSELNRAAD